MAYHSIRRRKSKSSGLFSIDGVAIQTSHRNLERRPLTGNLIPGVKTGLDDA